MPFYFPWSTAPAGQLSRNTAAYHWGKRSRQPRLVLTPETSVRRDVPIEVTGAGAVRSFIGARRGA